MIEIWNTTWVFYNKKGWEHKIENVVAKRIPHQFIINEESSYKNALRDILMRTDSKANLINELVIDPETKLKKHKVIFIKKIGYVNGSGMDELY